MECESLHVMSDDGRTPDATNADRERRRFLHCAAVITGSRQVSWSVLTRRPAREAATKN